MRVRSFDEELRAVKLQTLRVRFWLGDRTAKRRISKLLKEAALR